MDANVLVQGLLGGLIFTLAEWGISKIGGRSKEKVVSDLGVGFSGESLSLKERTAIIYLLMKIAECDGNLNSKELTQIQALMAILDYNPNNKDIESLAMEMEKYTVIELVNILSNMSVSQKEWFTKSSIILAESDNKTNQQESDFICPILTQLGISESKYSEIRNKIITSK